MKPVISIGNQDFRSIRENNRFYVDKTGFIKKWWESGHIVTLITRLRRLGKTLNINTVECFLSNQYAGREDLFQDLFIWKAEKLSEAGKKGKRFTGNSRRPCLDKREKL